MSSMIPAPPPRISIGGPAAGPGAGVPPTGGPTQSGPDIAAVREHINNAIRELRAAEEAEGDDQDAATIAKLVAQARAILGAHQQMEDQVMGGGPGAKMIRKSAPPAGAAGGGY